MILKITYYNNLMYDDDDIKLFKCSQCQQMKKMIIWKAVKPNIEAMCKKCWDMYARRMREIHLFGY